MGWENNRVQVLMSTYNGERFLEEQIESLLSQSWKNLEILIRDDGSTDGLWYWKTPSLSSTCPGTISFSRTTKATRSSA